MVWLLFVVVVLADGRVATSQLAVFRDEARCLEAARRVDVESGPLHAVGNGARCLQMRDPEQPLTDAQP